MRQRLSTRSVVLWAIATLALWSVAAGSLLLRARDRATSAESSITALAELNELDGLDLEATALDLRSASTEVEAARADLEHPLLEPLRLVPLARTQLASARALVRSADLLVDDALVIVDRAREAQAVGTEGDRIAAMTSLAEGFETMSATIDGLDLGPERRLAGPLADARTEVVERLAELEPRVQSYAIVSRGLASFLDGGRYLLLGANNAEMRLASGMHLSVGVVTLDDGRFDVPGLEPADDVDPIRGAALVDETVGERWGFLDPEDDFRKLAYSARFDEFVGPQALELWRALTGEELRGVVALDPYVLEAMLETVGEVTIEGERFDASNVVSYLLQDQYAQFVADPELDDTDEDESELVRDERRDRLSELASAVALQLGSTDWDPLQLVQSLEPAARGRHLMVYSIDPAEQAAWAELGIDGRLEGPETGVFWLNTGASKLDPFLDIAVEVEEEIVDGSRQVTYEVTTRNLASAALPDYALGPWEYLEIEEAGAYRGRLVFYAPNGVTGAELGPELRTDVFGPDGPVLVVASTPMTILPGETVTHTFTYRIPVELASVTVLPSVRFPVVQWSWADEVFDDAVERVVALGP